MLTLSHLCTEISVLLIDEFKRSKRCSDPRKIQRAIYLRQTDWGTVPLTGDLTSSPSPSNTHQIRFDPTYRLALVKTNAPSRQARISVNCIDTGRQLWTEPFFYNRSQLPSLFEYSNHWICFVQGEIRCWHVNLLSQADELRRIHITKAMSRMMPSLPQVCKFNYPEFLVLRCNGHLAICEVRVSERRCPDSTWLLPSAQYQDVVYELPARFYKDRSV